MCVKWGNGEDGLILCFCQIFDLEDHTPKTITTIKETYSPGPPVVTDEGGIVTIGGKEEY
jgi:hypothetical protein